MMCLYENIDKYIQQKVDEYIVYRDALYISSIIAQFDNQDHYSLQTAFNEKRNQELINKARKNIMDFIEIDFEKDEFELESIECAVYFEDSFLDFIIEENEKEFDRIKYCILLVAFVDFFLDNIKAFPEVYFIKQLKDVNNFKVGSNCFYRGQSNEKWRLLPSSLRSETKTCIYNLNMYLESLKKYNLENKYEKYIKYCTDESIYYKCAFFQHACAFSPLIDFSKSDIVAASFSLINKSSIGYYNNISSSLYVYIINNPEPKILRSISDIESFLFHDYKLYYIDKQQLYFGEKILFNNSSEILIFDSIEKIVKLLVPSICFIDLPTNDRMKYQKGLFLCFYNCIVLGGHIYYELSNNFKMIKLIIKPEDKDNILDEIRRETPEYDSNHILDPYQIFRE